MRTAKRANPDWLRKGWEQKKNETVLRIRAAVDALRRDKRVITYESIRGQVKATYGISISANTIKRNELAYEIYQANCTRPKAGKWRYPLLTEMISGAPEKERRAIQSKVSRLRREPKDALIVRLMTLERAVAKQRIVENRLREEIIRLSPMS
jgi:hypothetical protein